VTHKTHFLLYHLQVIRWYT